MTVNNIDLIKDLITGRAKEGEFFFLQFLKRRKDNPGMEKDMIVIDVMFIKNEEDLEKRRERIMKICEINNARAYIHLNKRSEKKIALQTLRIIADSIASENYNIRNAYTSACGQFHSDEDKTWVVDIDYKDVDLGVLHSIKIFVVELQTKTGRNPMLIEIPTRNGVHIITRPFNLAEFYERINPTRVDVHKDNPTILYIP